MYKNNKKNSLSKKILIIVVIIIFIIVIITIYSVYSTIDINSYDNKNVQNVVRLSSTIEDKKNTDKQVTDLLEKSIDCVVGISKIKDMGNTIFLKNW